MLKLSDKQKKGLKKALLYILAGIIVLIILLLIRCGGCSGSGKSGFGKGHQYNSEYGYYYDESGNLVYGEISEKDRIKRKNSDSRKSIKNDEESVFSEEENQTVKKDDETAFSEEQKKSDNLSNEKTLDNVEKNVAGEDEKKSSLTEKNQKDSKEKLELEKKKAAEEEKRKSEAKKAAEEEKRKAEAKKAAEEEKRKAEAKKAAEEEKRKAEAKKAAEEEKRKAEAKKAAEEEKRKAEAKKAAEEEKRKAEAKKAAEEEKKTAASKKEKASTSVSTLQELVDSFVDASTEEARVSILGSAVELANQILKENPDNDLAHYVLAQDALKRKNYDLTLLELQKAIEANKTNYLYFYDMGKVQYLLRKYSDAADSFIHSCELNNKFENSRYNLGLTYVKQGKFEEAIKAFGESVNVNPRYEKGYMELARAYSRLHNYTESIESYKKLLEVNPSNIKGLMELGSVYYESGDKDSAEKQYKTAISKLNKSEELTLTKYNLSTILYDEGKFTEALNMAWQAYDEKDFIKKNSSKANIVYNYALILEKNNKTDEAIECYNEVLSLNPEHTKARINLSSLYMSKSPVDIERVISLLEASSNDGESFELNNNLGTAYLMKEDYKKAVFYYLKALKIDKNDFDVKNNLANAYLKDSDYENARTIYLELLENDSNCWEAYLNLGKIYMQFEDDENALRMFLTLQQKNPDYRPSEVKSLIAVISG